MSKLVDSPHLLFVLSFVTMWLAVRIGVFLRSKRKLDEDIHEYFGIIVTATLTLTGLIIGFSFAMAVGRYDQRKNYEEAEANAIGTEYARADLLPSADAIKVRELLKDYLDLRVSSYSAGDERQVRQIDSHTAQLQGQLWAAVVEAAEAEAHPTPVIAWVVVGMNDVLNSQSSTQAAWINRIPAEAWVLMAAIAAICNLLVGYTAHRINPESISFVVLPLVISISFLLIADIDSPRAGLVAVAPQNLQILQQSLRAR